MSSILREEESQPLTDPEWMESIRGSAGVHTV